MSMKWENFNQKTPRNFMSLKQKVFNKRILTFYVHKVKKKIIGKLKKQSCQ